MTAWRQTDLRPLAVTMAALVLALAIGVALAANVLLGVGLMFGLGYMVVLLFAPVWALVAFIPLIFLAAVPALNLGGKAAGLFVAAAWIGAALTRREELGDTIRNHRRIFECVVALIVWLALTALWATDPGAVTSDLWHWVSVGLLFAIISTWVSDERTLIWFCGAFVVGAVIAVAIGAATGAVGATSEAAEARLEGGAGDPNFLAAGLVSAMILAAGVMSAAKNQLVRWGCFSAILICAFGVAASQSRGGVVALFAVGVASWFVFKNRRVYIALAVLAVLAVGAIYFSVQPGAWERVSDFGGSGSGRTDLWTVAWEASQDHPVGGVGLNNYGVIAKEYTRRPGELQKVNYIAERPHVVHNTYLEILTNTGVIGLAIFLSLLFGCCYMAWKAGKRFEEMGETGLEVMSKAVLVATIGMLVAIFFLSAGVDRRLWALLALGPATLAIAEARRRSSRYDAAP